MAEKNAKEAAAKAEAEAQKALKEKARQLALQEKEAMEALRQAELLAKNEAAARKKREDAERRLTELEERKAAIIAAKRAEDERRQKEEARQRDYAEKRTALAIAQERANAKRSSAIGEASINRDDIKDRQSEKTRLSEIEQGLRELETQKQSDDLLDKRDTDGIGILDSVGADEQWRKIKSDKQKTDWIERQNKRKKLDHSSEPKEIMPTIDSTDLPEWQQPVRF